MKLLFKLIIITKLILEHPLVLIDGIGLTGALLGICQISTI